MRKSMPDAERRWVNTGGLGSCKAFLSVLAPRCSHLPNSSNVWTTLPYGFWTQARPALAAL